MLAAIPEEFLSAGCEATATQARFLQDHREMIFGVTAAIRAMTPKIF
jgi:hypothetical protein